ncbi:uncharacterized protein LOC134659866 [Cydia amplana]|uniref:uncharacterized protein LOC134659866 n=1 Tax=Cydia amplana TaxID=1869771 RepID=UPI002FE65CD4
MIGRLKSTFLFIFLHCFGDVTSIGNVKLLIEPSIVKRNGTAVLTCYRDMQGAPLYTAKWYRGNHEFYRYTPLENPSTRVFGLPGIFVDMNNSDDKKVVLRKLEPSLAGNFSCEVTADSTFSTQTATQFLDVVVTPESQPVLQAEKEKYQPGELMRANCTSAPAKPPANLTIYINDEPLRSSETTLHPWDGGLSWASVGVELKVSPDLFPGGRLRVTCNATVYDVYNESAKLDFFTPETDPRPERITLGSNATRCFTSWLLIFFMLSLPIVLAQDYGMFNQDVFNEAYDNNFEENYDDNLYLIGSTPKKPLLSLIGH